MLYVVCVCVLGGGCLRKPGDTSHSSCAGFSNTKQQQQRAEGLCCASADTLHRTRAIDGVIPRLAHRPCCPQVVVESGVCKRLVQLLDHPSSQVVKPALRTIGNVVCAEDDADYTEAILEAGSVVCLKKLIAHPNREIQKEVRAGRIVVFCQFALTALCKWQTNEKTLVSAGKKSRSLEGEGGQY